MIPKDLLKHSHDYTVNAEFKHLSPEEQYKNRNLSEGEKVIGVNYSENIDGTHTNIIRTHCAHLIDLIEQSKMSITSMDKRYLEELADESKSLLGGYDKAISLIKRACDFIDVDFSETMWTAISGVPYGVTPIKLPGCDAARDAESARRKNKTRDYKKFFTPDAVADVLVALADVYYSHVILEPHAGDGAIVRAIRRGLPKICPMFPIVWANEINPSYVQPENYTGVSFLSTGDFLDATFKISPGYGLENDRLCFDQTGSLRFDRIIANPPFGNGFPLDQHVSKMISLLKPGGILVSIVPDDFIPVGCQYIPYELKNWATNSDGTTTPIKIIIITK